MNKCSTHGCKGNAEYKCSNCGKVYCKDCAEEGFYTCGCITIPELKKIQNE